MTGKLQNWVTLTSVQAGIYICTSALMTGVVLLRSYGLLTALLSLAVGCTFVWLLSIVFTHMGVTTRKPLISLIEDSLGSFGSHIGGMAFGISLVGWFAIQLNLMSQGLQPFFSTLSPWFIKTILGFFLTVSVIKGMRSISLVADLSMPFMLGIMIYILCVSFKECCFPPLGNFGLAGVPLVIMSALAGIIDSPTYYCFAKNHKHAQISIAVVSLGIMPFIALTGLFLSMLSPGKDLIPALMDLGGDTWKVILALFLILAGWTTNNGNLYSASVAFQGIPMSFPKRTFLLGSMGTLLSFFPLLQHYEIVLSMMSIVLASFGALLLVFYLYGNNGPSLFGHQKVIIYMIIGLGSFVGFVAEGQFITLTGFGFLDAFLISCFLGTSFILRRKWA
jgi:purine-cytosine permease-like protein